MFPVLFKLGPITIYTYGFFLFLGVTAGYFVCKGQADSEGIPPKIFSNIFFWGLVWGFVGARIAYILIEWRLFLVDPLSLILSRSGFVFYGGAIAGVAAVFILAKRQGINVLKLVDIGVLGIPLGHALGRIGCFCYGCCYGRPTDAPWGMLFPPDSPAGLLNTKVIPTQLISSFFLFLIFFSLLALKKHKRFDGQILLSYNIVYGIFRFIIEFYRGDPRGEVFFLSTSQFIALSVVIISIFLFVRWQRTG